MTLFKCKSCGGRLQLSQNQKTGECIYCGLEQTVYDPALQAKSDAMERAEEYRKIGKYELAAGQYAQALSYDKTDPEPYWGLVMCNYGILYVEDPETGKMVPTVNRASYDPILNNKDYLSALQYASDAQKIIYQKDGIYLQKVQQKILNISKQQTDYDVFISYKEKSDVGQKTEDSFIGSEIYHQLTNAGYKVFYSYVSLKEVPGLDYEAYIFSALHSAKVMLAIGTKKEYFESPWVRNEWSRYLSLIDKGEKKKLIPIYTGENPYTILPEDFQVRNLQGIDLSSYGSSQVVLNAVKNIVGDHSTRKSDNRFSEEVESLIGRTEILLQDKEYNEVRQYCKRILDLSPKEDRAYWLKMQADLGSQGENFETIHKQLWSNKDYIHAVSYAPDERKKFYEKTVASIQQRLIAEQEVGISRAENKIDELKKNILIMEKEANALTSSDSDVMNNIGKIVSIIDAKLTDISEQKQINSDKTQKLNSKSGIFVVAFFWIEIVAFIIYYIYSIEFNESMNLSIIVWIILGDVVLIILGVCVKAFIDAGNRKKLMQLMQEQDNYERQSIQLVKEKNYLQEIVDVIDEISTYRNNISRLQNKLDIR